MNRDFDDGYAQGKRSVNKAAGWIAGLGAAIIGPVAKRAADATEAAQVRAAIGAQEQARRQAAWAQELAHRKETFDARAAQLQTELKIARQRIPRWRIRHGLLVLSLVIGGGWLGWNTYGTLLSATLGGSLGGFVSLFIVESRRRSGFHRARYLLEEHLQRGVSRE